MKIVPIGMKAANEYVAAAFCAKRIMRSHDITSPCAVVNSVYRSRTRTANVVVSLSAADPSAATSTMALRLKSIAYARTVRETLAQYHQQRRFG